MKDEEQDDDYEHGGRGIAADLLHNMSVRPRTQIQHTAPTERRYGRGIEYRLPPEFVARVARKILAWLDGKPCRLVRRQAEAELRRRLNEHAGSLSLPPAVVVTDTGRVGDVVCEDPLTVLTVLTKSSNHVYLRDKEPNLQALRRDRRVILVVTAPPEKEQEL
jgi:hypothetical protein